LRPSIEYIVLRRRNILEVKRRDWRGGCGGDERGQRGYDSGNERIVPQRLTAYVIIGVPTTRIYGDVGKWTPCG
jgi:hypothetical protein